MIIEHENDERIHRFHGIDGWNPKSYGGDEASQHWRAPSCCSCPLPPTIERGSCRVLCRHRWDRLLLWDFRYNGIMHNQVFNLWKLLCVHFSIYARVLRCDMLRLLHESLKGLPVPCSCSGGTFGSSVDSVWLLDPIVSIPSFRPTRDLGLQCMKRLCHGIFLRDDDEDPIESQAHSRVVLFLLPS